MYSLYIVAILAHGVFSITPCQEGEKIVAQETKNPEDLLGNWTYVYHWDPKIKFEKEFIGDVNLFECPKLHFELATPEFVQEKKAECAEKEIPFKWEEVKLRVDAPVLKMEGGMIIIGEKENWMAVDCKILIRVVIKKASNYIAMVGPDRDSETELLVKEPPTMDELKCVTRNLDVPKGLSGFGICYK